MNKKFIGMLIILILLILGLSGCNELGSGDDTGLKVINYEVVTQYSVWKDNGTLNTYNRSGFYHDYPENAHPSYVVNITVKNKSGDLITFMYLYIWFCDKDNIKLFKEYTGIGNLPDTYTETITIESNKYRNERYFDLVENIQFEFTEDLITP